MKNNLLSQQGMTLVEVIVTSALMLVLSAGLMTILQFTTVETNEGLLSTRLQMQVDNAVEQISMSARSAAVVLSTNNEDFSNVLNYNTVNSSVTEITMFDSSGNIIAGYSVSGNVLEELDTISDTLKDYLAGSVQLELSSSSKFILPPFREGVGINITFTSTVGTAIDSISSAGSYVSCRN